MTVIVVVVGARGASAFVSPSSSFLVIAAAEYCNVVLVHNVIDEYLEPNESQPKNSHTVRRGHCNVCLYLSDLTYRKCVWWWWCEYLSVSIVLSRRLCFESDVRDDSKARSVCTECEWNIRWMNKNLCVGTTLLHILDTGTQSANKPVIPKSQ